MEKLIEKTKKLTKELNKTEEVIKIKELNDKIRKDQELTKLIEEYKYYPKESTKEKIINNKLFKEYKESETDLNILILQINKKLNEIKDKGKCSLWK